MNWPWGLRERVELEIFLEEIVTWGVLSGSVVKYLPAIKEMWGQSLGLEDFLKKEMAAHSSIVSWKIPWT